MRNDSSGRFPFPYKNDKEIPMRPLQRGALLLAGAVATGIGGAYLAEQKINQHLTAAEAALQGDYEKHQVLVAANDLTPGERVGNDTIAVRAVPATYLHSGAYSANQWSSIAGSEISGPMRAGETLLPAHIRRNDERRLAARLHTGERAITLPVSTSTSVTELIEPMDTVDLMLTLRDGENPITVPLLDEVTILAIGNRLAGMPVSGFGQRSQHITVAVNPLSAARLTHALTMGDLHLALRAPGDTEMPPPYEINESAIVEAGEDALGAEVEVIIGGAL